MWEKKRRYRVIASESEKTTTRTTGILLDSCEHSGLEAKYKMKVGAAFSTIYIQTHHLIEINRIVDRVFWEPIDVASYTEDIPLY